LFICSVSELPDLGSGLSLRAWLQDGAGDHREVARPRFPTANADAEPALGIAAAGVQAVGAKVAAAFIAAHQALAQNALLAVVTDRDVAAFDEVELAPVADWSFAGEIQRDHVKSIETWKLIPVAST
jgi:hypothetical protein